MLQFNWHKLLTMEQFWITHCIWSNTMFLFWLPSLRYEEEMSSNSLWGHMLLLHKLWSVLTVPLHSVQDDCLYCNLIFKINLIAEVLEGLKNVIGVQSLTGRRLRTTFGSWLSSSIVGPKSRIQNVKLILLGPSSISWPWARELHLLNLTLRRVCIERKKS